MNVLQLILLVFALVFFAIATAGVALPRVNFGWLGAACATAAFLVGAIH